MHNPTASPMKWMVCTGIAVACLLTQKISYSQEVQDSPKLIELAAGTIRMVISEPGHPQNYRGSRFDHSGMVHSLQFGEHQLCERWQDGPPKPDANDDVTGPCEEFGNSEPLGFQADQPGSPFLKIGVGVLKQTAEPKYQFYSNYEFLRVGKWTTKVDGNSVVFQQSMFLDESSKLIGYDYQKTISVHESGFSIHHLLLNIGIGSWKTDHYNHNFFMIDSDPVGVGYELEVPFAIRPSKNDDDFLRMINIQGKQLGYKESIGDRYFFAELEGHKGTTNDNRFVLRHRPSGVVIDCRCDRPLSKLNFWGTSRTICPEPYIQIELVPGQELSWTWDYQLSKLK